MTSEQARADAMADAETLRRIFDEIQPQDSTLQYAGWLGEEIDDRPSLRRRRSQARAAFRAVPGLRGE